MKLAHSIFETPLEISDNNINVLVVENQSLAAHMINQFISLCEGLDTDSFILSQDDKIIDFSKVEIISDLFRLEINQRKTINKLLAIMTETAIEEKYYEKTGYFISELYNYIENIADEHDYKITFEEATASDLFKVSNLKFETDAENLSEALLDYFNIYSNLINTQLFILVNLRQFLTEEETKAFYKDILYKRYKVLLFETRVPDAVLENEKLKIIDKDLCEIC